MDLADYQKLKKLIEPCQTPDELNNFIIDHWNIRLPWDTLDEDSTSSPLKFVWHVYNTLLTGKGESRHVLAASRNGGKTLTSSMLQFFSMIHFRREGAHIAATLAQAAQATRYLDTFLNVPLLHPYLTTDNVKLKEFAKLPANDFTSKDSTKIQVVTASKKGANAPRASFMTFDEVDLTPREILAEAAFIADPSIRYKTTVPDSYIMEDPSSWHGKTNDTEKRDTIFVYLSSRKTNDGPIQDLIDEAESPDAKIKRIKLHKWSTVDWMEKCPTEVHMPEKGNFNAYINTETLETIWDQQEFELKVPEVNRSQYKQVSAFEGCRTCPAFIACQARSVKQRSFSPMLRTKQFVGDVLSAVKSAAAIIAQALNWKPETTGLVFGGFSRHKHLKDPIDLYEWICGERFNPKNLHEDELDRIEKEGNYEELDSITPTKDDLYDILVQSGYTICDGVDWGFAPDPAVVIVIGYHKKLKKCVVLHFEKANNHANHIWARYVGLNVDPRFPAEFVAPDMADKASPSYFNTKEFKIPSLDTKPMRIEPGVSFIRGLLWDPTKQTINFAILDDSQLEGENKNYDVVEAFDHWTHKKTALGTWDMKKFADDNWTHPLDALRYALNPFIEDANIEISVTQAPRESEIRIAAARGDKDAIEMLQARQELKSQFQEHMATEFGLGNIFTKPSLPEPERSVGSDSAAKDQVKKTRKKSGGGIRFKI